MMKLPLPRLRIAFLLLAIAAAFGSPADRAAAQPVPNAPLVTQSIEGTLESIDEQLGGIILKGSDGKRHAWRLQAPVLREAARYKPGDWMWMIYRQLGPSERTVTALGFPGTQEKPVYVNATSDTIVLRTGPYTDGACRAVPLEQMTDHDVRPGAELVDEAPCWCCATRGKQCDLANRSHDERGTGRIVLARCFP
jgi:hypothetical protein